jgi:TolB-like protein/Tfp pilus assembly protein PilF
VLYFENATGDSADAYLADGLTEEIITRLSGVERLTVRSRYLVRRYRGAALDDPGTVGRALGVAYLVGGSLRRAGGRLRVSAELIRASGGAQIWGREFDQQGGDVFAIQAAVAADVASGIVGRLLPAERHVIAERPTQSSAAYDAYLLGRYHFGKRTAGDLVRAADYFRQAIAADSGFARAWSGLADSYVLFLPSEYDVPGIDPDTTLAQAERAARRALALAPDLGEAYASLGEILEYQSRWQEARAAFERAVALSPLYPTAHLWYAYDLEVWNRWDDAVREFEAARDLDPSSVVAVVSLGSAYDGAERPADAAAAFAQARALAPDHLLVRWFGAHHDLYRGDFDALAVDYERLLRLLGTDSAAAAAYAARLRDPSQREAALREQADRAGAPVSWHIQVHEMLDGDDSVIAFLARVTPDPKRNRVGAVIYCGCVRPTLRSDPRFRAALARLGFPRD